MNRTDSMIERRALHIAVWIMAFCGMCKLGSKKENCKKKSKPCIECIKHYLRELAKDDLHREGKL